MSEGKTPGICGLIPLESPARAHPEWEVWEGWWEWEKGCVACGGGEHSHSPPFGKAPSEFSLLPAFSQMGYNLSPQFSQLLLARYAQRSPNPSIQLDRFIHICMQLQSLTDAFREKDTAMVGNVRLSYEDFLTMVVTRML